MADREWSDIEILILLQRIDGGYEPDEEEKHILAERKRMSLWRLSITELPESIGQLTALESLNLSHSRITELPESIGQLTALEELGLTGTPIDKLPESMGELRSLITLRLGDTQITKLPGSIRRLPKLEELLIWRTRITELPEWIGELPSLRYLDLEGLTLERIPRSLALKGLPFVEGIPIDRTGILTNGIKLLTQDVSIFLDTPELIPSLYDEEQIVVPECKVIFLGDGGVGKTYTIRRINNKGEEESEKNRYKTSETPGVEISDCQANDENGEYTIHFWDFGGQEILHSMHRCFLTKQTSYVVMIRTRDGDKAESRARYWLRNVKAIAPESPVMLYVNCWESEDPRENISDPKDDFDETSLRADFPNIKDIVYCSAKKASKEEFQNKLIKKLFAMAGLPEGGCRQTIPASWKKVRDEIIKEHKDEPVMDKESYRAVCEKYGIEDANAPAILTFFNNIGTCFSYHRDKQKKELAAYKLLRPIWLTNALYAIIRECASSAQDGRINISAIEEMLINDPRKYVNGKMYSRPEDCVYEIGQSEYVVDVAASHELCYRLKDDRLFFPALCKNDTPKKALGKQAGFPIHAEYRFGYEYLPDNVIHKLMIRLMTKDLNVFECWRKGMIVGCWDEHRIIIRMVDDDWTLRVDVYSKEGSPACEAFPIIRREIIDINDTIGLKAKEAVIEGEDSFTMASLLPAFREKDEGVRGSASGKVFRPKDLLYKFYDSMTLYELEPDEKGYVNRKPYQFHKESKDDPIVKRAIYEAYGKKCQYCGEIMTWQEMNIDHILPESYKSDGDQSVEFYLGELRSRGFDTAKPNFIENYVPAHRYCNIRKSGDVRMVSTLREYHAIALKHTQKVLELIEKYKEECKPE